MVSNYHNLAISVNYLLEARGWGLEGWVVGEGGREYQERSTEAEFMDVQFR
jgi:hypothetical protein